MYDLTIDVCVLIDGSGRGSKSHQAHSFALMKKIENTSDFFLALDKRGKIEHQYNNKMKHGTFGHHWLIVLAGRNKIKKVPWILLDRGTKTALKEAHFNSAIGEDYKYVVTASGTCCKILVTRDFKDYSRNVCRILKRRLNIKVESAQNCLPL